MGVGVGAIAHLHRHVVDVVGIDVGRRLEVRRHRKGQRTRARIDRELGCIRTATDAVGQCRTRIDIGRRCGVDRAGGVLGEAGRRATADRRGVVVDVGDVDRHRLIGDIACHVGDVDRDRVGVAACRTPWRLEVRRADETQCAA